MTRRLLEGAALAFHGGFHRQPGEFPGNPGISPVFKRVTLENRGLDQRFIPVIKKLNKPSLTHDLIGGEKTRMNRQSITGPIRFLPGESQATNRTCCGTPLEITSD